ncbi:MAG: hypothetical protein HFJ40_06950 [Clostridia bacterium]|nr:hypothetical protein [Clostridia bacterium]
MKKVRTIGVVILSEEERVNDNVWEEIERILIELEYEAKQSNQNNDTIIFHTYGINKDISIDDIHTIVYKFEETFKVTSFRFDAQEDEWNQEKPSLLLKVQI